MVKAVAVAKVVVVMVKKLLVAVKAVKIVEVKKKHVPMGHVAAKCRFFLFRDSLLECIEQGMLHTVKVIRYNVKDKCSELWTKDWLQINKKPLALLEDYCSNYGLSVSGSQGAIRRHLNILHKVPILVHPLLQCYFLPTMAPNQHDCIFINAKRIHSTKAVGCDTLIIFDDETNMVVPLGHRAIKKQVERAKRMAMHIQRQYQLDHLSLESSLNTGIMRILS